MLDIEQQLPGFWRARDTAHPGLFGYGLSAVWAIRDLLSRRSAVAEYKHMLVAR